MSYRGIESVSRQHLCGENEEEEERLWCAVQQIMNRFRELAAKRCDLQSDNEP